MTQLAFTLTTPDQKRPWRRVRDTSKAAYAEGRERFTGRKADVLRWLAAYYNRCNSWPTSAELREWATGEPGIFWTNYTDCLLYVRRGLSDLQAEGLVESVEKRPCRVTGTTCMVWRVVQR